MVLLLRVPGVPEYLTYAGSNLMCDRKALDCLVRHCQQLISFDVLSG